MWEVAPAPVARVRRSPRPRQQQPIGWRSERTISSSLSSLFFLATLPRFDLYERANRARRVRQVGQLLRAFQCFPQIVPKSHELPNVVLNFLQFLLQKVAYTRTRSATFVPQ